MASGYGAWSANSGSSGELAREQPVARFMVGAGRARDQGAHGRNDSDVSLPELAGHRTAGMAEARARGARCGHGLGGVQREWGRGERGDRNDEQGKGEDERVLTGVGEQGASRCVEAVRGGRGRVGDGGGVDYGGEVEAARSPGGGGAAHSDGADVQGRRARCPFPIQIGSGKRGEGEGEPERRRRGGRRGEGADAREGIGRGEILSPARCVRACLCVCVVWWRRVRETRGRWGS